MTATVKALLAELAPAVERLVAAEVARRVPEGIALALDHIEYRSVADLRWAIWARFELNRQQVRAAVEQLGLDPDELNPFHAKARASIAIMLREIEASLTAPSVH